KDAVIAIQVSPGRKPKRAAEARNSEKNSRSGSPRFAADASPGIGKAMEKVVKTCSWCLTISFVGPRGENTENASTNGMMHATRTTQLSCSKYGRNAKPRKATAKSWQKFSGVFQPASCHAHASAATPRAAGTRPGAVRSGRTSHTSAKTAGIRTNARKATSHHCDALQSRSWTA